QSAERQSYFHNLIKTSGKHWSTFDSVDQLCRLVLRDGWQMNDRPALGHSPAIARGFGWRRRGHDRKAERTYLERLVRQHQYIQVLGRAQPFDLEKLFISLRVG